MVVKNKNLPCPRTAPGIINAERSYRRSHRFGETSMKFWRAASLALALSVVGAASQAQMSGAPGGPGSFYLRGGGRLEPRRRLLLQRQPSGRSGLDQLQGGLHRRRRDRLCRGTDPARQFPGRTQPRLSRQRRQIAQRHRLGARLRRRQRRQHRRHGQRHLRPAVQFLGAEALYRRGCRCSRACTSAASRCRA